MSDAALDTQPTATWITITCGAGAVGGVATAVPFVSTFAPSERAKAAGAPVRSTSARCKPGEKLTVEWRGKPVWIVRRTSEQLDSLKKTDAQVADPNSDRTQYPTPDYAKNEYRSIKPEYLVAVGICSHLGCSPIDKLDAGRAAVAARRLARRLPLPLPWFHLRPRRPRIQEQARAGQPRGPAAHVPVRHHADHRRGQAGLIPAPYTRSEEHMAEFKDAPAGRLGGREDHGLVREPLPDRVRRVQGAPVGVLRAEELQLLVFLRLAGAAGAGDPDRHRHLPGDALQARREPRLRVGRVHHARRALGLAGALHALHRRQCLLHRRLPAHVPRDDLRQLPQAARAGLDLRLR